MHSVPFLILVRLIKSPYKTFFYIYLNYRCFLKLNRGFYVEKKEGIYEFYAFGSEV